MIEKTEDTEDVASHLYPNFIETIRILDVFQIRFWYSLKLFNQAKRPDDLISYLLPLLQEELLKIILVENNSSVLLFFTHN